MKKGYTHMEDEVYQLVFASISAAVSNCSQIEDLIKEIEEKKNHVLSNINRAFHESKNFDSGHCFDDSFNMKGIKDAVSNISALPANSVDLENFKIDTTSIIKMKDLLSNCAFLLGSGIKDYEDSLE